MTDRRYQARRLSVLISILLVTQLVPILPPTTVAASDLKFAKSSVVAQTLNQPKLLRQLSASFLKSAILPA